MNSNACIEKVYILDGGRAQVDDASLYSPGINVGIPMVLSCNAYLIRHRGRWLLWDTGTQDDLIAEPEGRVIAHGIRGTVRQTLAAQLADIGVGPHDIDTLVLSHAHYDHAGNSRLFPRARWIAQQAEYDAMFGADPTQFGYRPELYATLLDNPRVVVDGDYDVYGDDAVRLLATPGHTPGHCSLMIRLPRSGPVILSGDMAHNRFNFRCRCVPSLNADETATRASMEKIDRLQRATQATVWFNHDTEQSATLPHAPRWIV
ncbi:Beta-lactamase-like protein (plasmid) [Sodalis praecaptivus]|uniref:Beta-lactamase-like protein n=1 Tax=Sodalis praecaptivus TaxID=1239307 RepID=W0I301_9GAMM|nr:N-acyl homoserine lactonase family protein [Sodalis praecaptivus]AHF79132.1 Beta-lactamase-like protein [Sodalis praecaptivus]